MKAVSVAMPSGLSHCSSSVNSLTSTAVTVIVAKAGFSSWVRLSSGVSSLDAAEVDFLRLEDSCFVIPPIEQCLKIELWHDMSVFWK
ncbi:hypothetical protein [Nostoc sp.]|uniref:hypothetical protein n=1 Tax=Nostoc sp. TaxID=1180 RepID=UPI002FFB7162